MIIEDFLHAIESDGVPLCDGINDRRSVELVNAIYQSAGTGVSVDLSRKGVVANRPEQ